MTSLLFSEEEYDLETVGSPYHMAPEVLCHKPYNMKVYLSNLIEPWFLVEPLTMSYIFVMSSSLLDGKFITAQILNTAHVG